MNRIRWYGPTVALVVTLLIVMIAGPGMVRRLEWTRTDAQIQLARQRNEQSPTLQEMSAAFRNVARVVQPSVVHIQVYRRSGSAASEDLLRRLLPNQPRQPQQSEKQDPEMQKFNPMQPAANGSGWVYDKKGHIVTNHHVIKDADKIIVRFGDGAEHPATVVGTPDAKTDIAVLKVTGHNLHPAKQAPDKVEQGDIVFAFGSPFQFEFSMSQGIVSGMGRQLGILRQFSGYENFIQTDAAINPGNSGGPLTNINGEVVGMNHSIATRNGANQGLGFAIPVDMVRSVVDSIVEKGRVFRGYMGVYIEDLTPKMAATFGFKGKGVLVQQPIPGSPGAKAGMKEGDIITKVDGMEVGSVQQLRQSVAQREPGTKIKIEAFRKGKTVELSMAVAEAPDRNALALLGKGNAPGPKSNLKDKALLLKRLGITGVKPFTKAMAQQFGRPFKPGIFIEQIRRHSSAQLALLARGSVIMEVMDKPVATVEQLVDELAKHDLTKGVRIRVQNTDGFLRFELLELEE